MRRLTTLFPSEFLEEHAEFLGVVEREGKLQLPALVWALVEAHDRGYYEIPRETTTADVADAMGVHRRTVEEHLRRAEAKVVDEILPYLR